MNTKPSQLAWPCLYDRLENLLINTSAAHMCHLAPALSFGSLILSLTGGANRRSCWSVDHWRSTSSQRCPCLVFIGTGAFAVCHTQSDISWTRISMSDSWMLWLKARRPIFAWEQESKMLRVRVFGSARTRQVTYLGSINICVKKGQRDFWFFLVVVWLFKRLS